MKSYFFTAASLSLLATVSAAISADESGDQSPGDIPAPYGLEYPAHGDHLSPARPMPRPYSYTAPPRIYLEKVRYENGYLLRVHTSGIKAEDIEVQADRGRLRLRVERSRQSEWQSEQQPYRRSSVSSRSSMRRSVRLPYDADGSKLTAGIENGVLEIRIPARTPPGL